MKVLMKSAALILSLAMIICGNVTVKAGQSAESTDIVLPAAPADEWTALFDRSNVTSPDWLAADGIYTVALDGDDSFASADDGTKTMFIFSDTITGVSDQSGKITRSGFLNHSSAILTGGDPDPDNMSFVMGRGGNGDVTKNVFTDENLWLFDCFTTGGNVYVIAFAHDSAMKPSRIDLIKIPIQNGTADYAQFENTGTVSQLYYRTDDYLYAFGMGVTCNTVAANAPDPDGYIYFYGYRDSLTASDRRLIAARVSESDFPDFSNIRYWNGTSWDTDIESSAPLIEKISCETSVSPITTGPYAGKYIAVYTYNTRGTDLMYAIGDSPVGPFDTPVCFYKTPEHGVLSHDGTYNLYTYNAKAHPHLSDGSKLLVSYNVNISRVASYTMDYTPRFVWLYLDPQNERPHTVGTTAIQMRGDNSAVRLVTAVDGLDYYSVGFEVTVAEDGRGSSDTRTFSSQNVYRTLAYGNLTVSSRSFSITDGYLAVFNITDIPSDFTVTARAFAVDLKDKQTKYYGESRTYTVSNGEIEGVEKPKNNIALASNGGTAFTNAGSRTGNSAITNLNDSSKALWNMNTAYANQEIYYGIYWSIPQTVKEAAIIRRDYKSYAPADTSGYAVEVSTDTTNGTDGTWVRVSSTVTRQASDSYEDLLLERYPDTTDNKPVCIDSVVLASAMTVRGIRIIETARGDQSQIYELEVYEETVTPIEYNFDTNVAPLGTPEITRSVSQGSVTLANLNDGDTSSRCVMNGSPSAEDPYYAGVSWTDSYIFNKAVIYWNSATSIAATDGYVLQYSIDGGTTYYDIDDAPTRDGLIDTVELSAPVVADAVRIRITGMAEGVEKNLSIKEFEIYGEKIGTGESGDPIDPPEASNIALSGTPTVDSRENSASLLNDGSAQGAWMAYRTGKGGKTIAQAFGGITWSGRKTVESAVIYWRDMNLTYEVQTMDSAGNWTSLSASSYTVSDAQYTQDTHFGDMSAADLAKNYHVHTITLSSSVNCYGIRAYVEVMGDNGNFQMYEFEVYGY